MNLGKMTLRKIGPTNLKDSTVRHCNFFDISSSISVRVESGHRHLTLYNFLITNIYTLYLIICSVSLGRGYISFIREKYMTSGACQSV